MRVGARLGIVIALTAACGGEPRVPPATPPPPSPEPVALLAELPEGAQRCAVARPGLVSSARRGLLSPLTHADRLAWHPDVPVHVYVQASSADGLGGSRGVAVGRFVGPRREARRGIDRAARVDWEADRGRRLPFARFVDDRTFRIERGGAWPPRRPGVEVRCRELLREFPDALEVSVRVDEGEAWRHFDLGPTSAEAVLLPAPDGVTRLERERFAGAEGAAEHELGSPGTPAAGPFPDRLERYRNGRVVTTRARYLWQDLELTADDMRRRASARAEASRAEELLPVPLVDVTDRALLTRQIEQRRARLVELRGRPRAAAAEQLRALLARAVEAWPTDEAHPRDLARLLVDELGDGAGAAQVASAALAAGLGDPAAFGLLVREALAASSVPTLADTLVAEGLFSRAAAPRVAVELATLQARGVDYEQAEAASIVVEALSTPTRRAPLRPARSGSLPLRSLPETLATLVRLGDEAPAERAVYVLVRATLAEPPPWDPSYPSWIALGHAADARLFGAFTLGDGGRPRALGEALPVAVAEGPCEVVMAFVPFDADASRPDALLRLSGRVDGGDLVIERASRRGPPLDWPRVARYLAAPLASFELQTFPPPIVDIEALDDEDVERVRSLARGVGGLECDVELRTVSCLASVERAAAVVSLVHALARDRLAAEIARAGR